MNYFVSSGTTTKNSIHLWIHRQMTVKHNTKICSRDSKLHDWRSQMEFESQRVLASCCRLLTTLTTACYMCQSAFNFSLFVVIYCWRYRIDIFDEPKRFRIHTSGLQSLYDTIYDSLQNILRAAKRWLLASLIYRIEPIKTELECGPMPNLMVALPNIGGALCSTPQSLADAHH